MKGVGCRVQHVGHRGRRKDCARVFTLRCHPVRVWHLGVVVWVVGCRVQGLRGGLVLKAHRHCVSLNSRLESNKVKEKGCRGLGGEPGDGALIGWGGGWGG